MSIRSVENTCIGTRPQVDSSSAAKAQQATQDETSIWVVNLSACQSARQEHHDQTIRICDVDWVGLETTAQD
jgi:hypothetical protein